MYYFIIIVFQVHRFEFLFSRSCSLFFYLMVFYSFRFKKLSTIVQAFYLLETSDAGYIRKFSQKLFIKGRKSQPIHRWYCRSLGCVELLDINRDIKILLRKLHLRPSTAIGPETYISTRIYIFTFPVILYSIQYVLSLVIFSELQTFRLLHNIMITLQ